MAFGIKRTQLNDWKRTAAAGDIAFLTHYWLDDRFPGCTSVTKVACTDLEKLEKWGKQYGLKKEWIHMHEQFPHFDLFGKWQQEILKKEKKFNQLTELGRNEDL